MPPQDQTEASISLLQVCGGMLRRRRVVIGVPLGLALVVVLLTLLWPRTYTAWMAFTPDTNQGQLSALAGVAADFGVNLPAGDNTQSSQFYVDLISGQAFLERVVDQPFILQAGDSTEVVRLDTLFGTNDANPAVARAQTAKKLGRLLNSTVTTTSGIAQVSLSLRSAALAKAVIERVLTHIQVFDTKTRQSRGHYERVFIEQQVDSATEALRVAEDRTSNFLVRNRDFRNSPRLQFEADRLQRVVALQQGVLETLSQSLQQARIDEVKAEPALTMVEPPSVSALPDRRRLALKAILAFIGAFGVVTLIIVGEAAYGAAALGDRAAAEAIASDLAIALRPWRGWFGRIRVRLGSGSRKVGP